MDLQIKQHKESLRAIPRSVVFAERATGKTRAILELIHEDHEGNAAVVTLNGAIVDFLVHEYRRLYPQDGQPLFVSQHHLGFLGGLHLPVYSDEVHGEIVSTGLRHLFDYRGGLSSFSPTP